ncbi:histidine kinase dimerization/phospho-acceptor domain-containing protein [Limnoglobus roseus]|uniref:histidine kinase n=1 Tax=Limnoglobus roseus TaxID=2598579 RepID=A0A5C1AMH0_9BACT|nr:histidine kinase dimerization/phospho-acceptor domain-containing protein [Limnoglobus roseus]QEL20619.1 PAS domain S-box protein [Limnoglobus roseus]
MPDALPAAASDPNAVRHDLNNLLTVVRGFALLLAEDLPTGDLGREYVAEILGATDRIAALVDRALDRRPESGNGVT